MKRLAGVLLAAALGACVHQGGIKFDRVKLGRVVVYRNGVAFYERHATVRGGVLTVSVPRERVDDFLKSLTVVDTKTQKPLPISIPRQESDDGTNLVMKLQLPGTDVADVVLTYVTESPAWKPSYRVVVGDKAHATDGTVMLEGWAIVDNTSGEDWKGVLVGVGSSSALSFKYDLWSVRTVERETLQAEERFAVAPPNGVAPFASKPPGDSGGADAPIDLADDQIRHAPGPATGPVQPSGGASVAVAGELARPAPPPPPSAPMPEPTSSPQSEEVISVSGRSARADGADEDDDEDLAKASKPAEDTRALERERLKEGDARMRELALSLQRSNKHLVIEGYADGSRPGAVDRAKDRANVVRNQLIDAGVAPGRIEIVTHTNPGNAEHVRLVTQAAEPPAPAKQPGAADADAQPVGESHFESPLPMTVEKGASAMVSMVRAPTTGEVVYLYDAESERGNDHFAFRAVRFKNPTDSTLETGPVTVYGNERFIGEGLTEPIAPHSIALVPFALDRQIVVDHASDDDNKLARLITLQRGVLTAEVQHIRHDKLTVTNRLGTPAKVFIRHTVHKGWQLTAAPPRDERVGDAHLFEVDVAPGASQQVDIAEATPVERTLDLSADATLDMMKLYVDAPEGTPELKTQLRKLLGIHKTLVDLTEQQESVHRRLGDYRERMDELHGQIVTLTAVKTGGDLMAHLKDKMKDISERVQKATIELVDTEEKIMLTRVQFQDALAELTLPDVTQPAGDGKAALLKK
ncbi:MAG TPA: OmpA family protein [Kofleriaceae bacterium]|nr:OmpA family protein [Kofleriaceae bacterium]